MSKQEISTMVKPHEIAAMEQTAQAMKDHYCPLIKTLYDGFVDAGFSERQAFELAKAYLTKPVQGAEDEDQRQ